MRILGIDPGIRHLGVALFEGGRLLFAETIVTGERPYAVLLRELERIVEDETPHRVVVEGAFAKSRFSSPHTEALGIVKAVLERYRVIYDTLAPSSWKKALLGDGTAKKKDVIEFLRNNGFTVRSPHEADAVGICLAYMNLKKRKETGHVCRV